ncbi:MAG: FtsX-like permease family protein [Patescibacteria group bacterium]
MDTQKFQEKEFKIQREQNMVLKADSHHLRFGDLFKLSLRVFRVRPARTLLTILGISIGIGTVLFLVSLGYGLQYILIGKLAATEDSLVTLDAYYPTESNLNIMQKDIDEILVMEGAQEISPVAEFTGETKLDTLSGFVMVKIVRPNYFRLSGTAADKGSVFTEGEKSAIISNNALQLFDLDPDNALGKKVSVKVFFLLNQESEVKTVDITSEFNIKGIINDDTQQPFIMIPFDSVPEAPPSYQRILVKAKSIDEVEPLRDKLIAQGFLISARIDLVNQAKKIMTIITIILGVFGVTALVVSAIGMFNTMIIGFMERIFEVGIMKSIGASIQDIRNLFLMESFIMGILGGIGGILIGILSGEIFNLVLNLIAKNLGGKSVQLFIYPWQFLIFIFIISALVGISSGFWPARKASKLSPKQAFIQK